MVRNVDAESENNHHAFPLKMLSLVKGSSYGEHIFFGSCLCNFFWHIWQPELVLKSRGVHLCEKGGRMRRESSQRDLQIFDGTEKKQEAAMGMFWEVWAVQNTIHREVWVVEIHT